MSTDDAESTEDERDIELSSLAAIFPEIILEPSDNYDRKARLDIEINLHRPLRVSFAPLSRHGTNTSVPSNDGKGQDTEAHLDPDRVGTNVGQLSVSLQHLPSLSCHMTLPKAYPEDASPIIALKCDPSWLSDLQIGRLEKHALHLWEEYGHSVMLFDYLDWLGQAAETAFDVAKDAPSNIIVLPRTFEAPLLDFDLRAKKRKFAAGTFDCGVCLEPKKGSACHRMSQCGHVFCTDCLKDFYNNCIMEGDVSNVKCMGFGCEKERLQKIPESRRKRLDLTIKPSELAEIPLEHEKIQRFVHLKQKKELESSGNVVFCPRKWCQGAARAEKKKKGVDDSDSEPEEDASTTENLFGDRLAICSECGFAFCRRCLKGPWHGEHVICRPPRKADELTEEEKATEEYLSAHSARCPTCGAPVQKTMGCNHMVCELCRTHFCYLCQAYLLEGNPYAHFNTPGQGCYQRLWVLEGGDDENAELAERIPDDHVDFVVEDEEEENPAPEVAAVQPNIVIPDPVIEFAEDTSSSEEDEVAPPPAPLPPPQRGRGRGRGAARGRAGGQAGERGGAHHGRGRGNGAARAAGNEGLARAAANVARGNIAPRGEVAEVPGGMDRAIRRFVQMALHDQEDQWDSDELDSDGDDDWVIPVRGRVP